MEKEMELDLDNLAQKIKEIAVNEGYEDLYELRTGNFKATPAMVASDDEFIMLIFICS